MTIDYNEKIPNNVGLADNRTLQRALEHWQPAFRAWWSDMGPEGTASTDVYLQGIRVCKNGLAANYNEPALIKKLDEPEVSIRLVIHGNGSGEARFWTCDFTEGYIRINGSYRT